MSKYQQLKDSISQSIKENGNNEITGSLLQSALLSMINALGVGFQYVGIATPSTVPGTPDQNVFYFSSTPGVYVNFGAIEVLNGEFVILQYDGSWQKKIFLTLEGGSIVIKEPYFPIVEQNEATVEIRPNVYNRWSNMFESLNITLATPEDTTVVNEYIIEFQADFMLGTILTLPEDIIFNTPLSIEAGRTYQISIVENKALWAVF